MQKIAKFEKVSFDRFQQYRAATARHRRVCRV